MVKQIEEKSEIETMANNIRNIQYIVDEMITSDDIFTLAFSRTQLMHLCKVVQDGKKLKVRAFEYLDNAFEMADAGDDYRFGITKFLIVNKPFLKEIFELVDLPLY